MTTCPYNTSESSTGKHWDFIIIGGGLSGITAAYKLSSNGRRVIIVEEGLELNTISTEPEQLASKYSDDPVRRLRNGRAPTKVSLILNNEYQGEHYFPAGVGIGGSSNLYAAQLERFRKSDFSMPKSHASTFDSSTEPRWPISYEEFLPYYQEAEHLYDVREFNASTVFTEDSQKGFQYKKAQAELHKLLHECGIIPNNPHLGLSYARNCDGCPGYICQYNCKSDARKIWRRILEEGLDVTLRTESKVERIMFNDIRATGVILVDNTVIFGSQVLLAAGALSSPLILRRSLSPTNNIHKEILNNNNLGGNLMFHVSSSYLLLRKGLRPFIKGYRSSHKYFGTDSFYIQNKVNLGTFQSLALHISTRLVVEQILFRLFGRNHSLPRWNTILKLFVLPIASIQAYLFRRGVLGVTILEDFPYLHNSVEEVNGGKIVRYSKSDELIERSNLLDYRLRRSLSSKFHVIRLSPKNGLNYGHPCGTMRMSDSQHDGVVDKNCRVHGLSNLYAVDASILPRSAGINPSLTIISNSLRVCEYICSKCP